MPIQIKEEDAPGRGNRVGQRSRAKNILAYHRNRKKANMAKE